MLTPLYSYRSGHSPVFFSSASTCPCRTGSRTSLHHAVAHNRCPNWRLRAKASKRYVKAQSSSYRYTESSDDSHQFTSMFTPLADKLQTQLGLMHPIPAPPINKSIVGFFVFFFFFGVVFDKLWTGRNRPSKPDAARPGIWPPVPTSFSLFLEKDLRRKESVEWVNMVLVKLWKVYRSEIENWITGLLQPVIDNLKKPDYVQRVEIKQFSLGDEPLSVRNVERRTSRRVNDLQYQIGIRYTGGARVLLSLSLKMGIIPIVVPVRVRDFDIDGELWVKLRLIPSEPWVGAVSWAFVSLPKIKFELSPFRLFNLMAIPVLSMFLTKLFTKDLPRLFVRPKKIVLDFQKGKAVGPISDAFKTDAVQEGNKDFVGELSVTLVDARKLAYVILGKTDPYVVLSLGDQVIRSKKNSQTSVIGPPGEPIWNQDFSLLVANSQKQKLHIQVKDSFGFIDFTVGTGEVRKQAYQKGNSVPYANVGVLDELISARHELAQIMDCKSYSEFAIRPNMAASPDVVKSFLVDLSSTIKHKADEEFHEMQDFKRQRHSDTSVTLEPWDEAYFSGLMKSSIYDLDSSVIASYFPVSRCLEGLKVLVESLFGARFSRIPVLPGESWHPDVIKLSLSHPQEGDLGFMYLDLYSRKGKYPGCAHFAIRGGRRLSESEYQLPIVALVCNFAASPGSAASRLNHWDVETLFHEFGHALHSLLSRTNYQHFSGTRVVVDLAETPSNIFEYYAWDYRVLRTFARHYATGEIIPEKLVKSMNSARNMFAAMELQRQIFFSFIDLTLFGEQTDHPIDTVSVVADLKKRHTSWNHVEGTHWHTKFSHLVNYGSGYYSYLYARCFAATIWQEVCQEDPLSLSTGSAIRAKFLQHGGAKDPARLLKDLAGDGILKSCGGGIVPDISCLCKEIGL